MAESIRLPMGLFDKEEEASTAPTAKKGSANRTDGSVTAYRINATYSTLGNVKAC